MITASVGEKRKRLKGKVTEEPPVISCTTEELNYVLDKWIGDGVVRLFIVSRQPTMSNITPSIIGPSRHFFRRN